MIPGQTGFTYVTRHHELFAILGDASSMNNIILLKFFFSKLRVA